jgi:signal transduction histidine kinase
MRHTTQNTLLNLTAYLTTAGAAAGAVLLVDRILLRWQVILLLGVFAALHSRLPAEDGEAHALRTANLLIGAQALIVGYLAAVTSVGFSLLVLFFILSVSAALYNPLRGLLLWIGAFTVFTAWYLLRLGGWAGVAGGLATYTGGYLFFGFVTLALSAARRAQATSERLLVELRAKNVQLEEYAGQVETLAAVEERNRLAREVHDTLGHRLTSTAVQLEAAERLAARDPAKTAELVSIARQQVREGLQELRQTVGRLRAPLEIELSLPQALTRLVQGFQAASELQVHLELPETMCETTPSQRLAIYRAAQEGLTNVQRHAQARQAWLRLVCEPGELRLELRDDGIGVSRNPSPETIGFGLRGLRERAVALGGYLALETVDGGGSRLVMRLPRADTSKTPRGNDGKHPPADR